MADLVAQLGKRGKSLSPEDRARVVNLLLETHEEPSDASVSEAWRCALRSRVSAYERAEAVLFDADDVIVEAMRLTQ